MSIPYPIYIMMSQAQSATQQIASFLFPAVCNKQKVVSLKF